MTVRSDTDGRVERGQATRAEVLAVAERLFTELGYETTSISTVLSESGVSRGAFYHHFPSKEALFETVLESVETRVEETLRAAAAKESDPVDAIRAGCRAWLSLAGDPTVLRITLTDAPSVVGWSRWREIDEQHGFGLLVAGLRATGRFPDELVHPVAHMLLAATLEAALLVARAGPRSKAAASARAGVEELLDRVLAAKDQPRAGSGP
ncbi:MAG: TetR/AcrR family transcriptional regulator [Thermoleophilaceae bacterium]